MNKYWFYKVGLVVVFPVSYTHLSYVPRGKISGSGCSPLVIGGKVDKQRIKCRKHDSKSDPHQQCDTKKQDVYKRQHNDHAE